MYLKREALYQSEGKIKPCWRKSSKEERLNYSRELEEKLKTAIIPSCMVNVYLYTIVKSEIDIKMLYQGGIMILNHFKKMLTFGTRFDNRLVGL